MSHRGEDGKVDVKSGACVDECTSVISLCTFSNTNACGGNPSAWRSSAWEQISFACELNCLKKMWKNCNWPVMWDEEWLKHDSFCWCFTPQICLILVLSVSTGTVDTVSLHQENMMRQDIKTTRERGGRGGKRFRMSITVRKKAQIYKLFFLHLPRECLSNTQTLHEKADKQPQNNEILNNEWGYFPNWAFYKWMPKTVEQIIKYYFGLKWEYSFLLFMYIFEHADLSNVFCSGYKESIDMEIFSWYNI